MERNDGENWLSVDEAAERLSIDADALHLRIKCGHLTSKGIGSNPALPHLRETDVEEIERVGLPHADMEARMRGDVIAVPDDWLTLTRSNAAYGPSAFVALRPMIVGPNRRPLFPGDLFGADDGHVTPGQLERGEVVELPIRYGVLALLAAQQKRIERLEAELAEVQA